MKKIFPNDIHSITQLVNRIILLNVLFILVNLPFVILTIVLGIQSIQSSPFPFFIASITIAPAAIALFRATFSIIDDPTKGPYKLFFKTFKQAFSKETVPLFAIHLLLFLLSFDKIIFSLVPSLALLAPFYFLLRVLCLASYPILCLELALFKNPLPAVLQNGIILLFSKPLLSVTTVIYFLFTLMIINEFPASLVLFTFSLYTYLFISFMYHPVSERIAKCQLQEGIELNDISTNY